MDRPTIELIERIDAYADELGSEPTPDLAELRDLEETLANLLVAVWERTGRYMRIPCAEIHCRSIGTDHAYGDPSCDFLLESEVRAKPTEGPTPLEIAEAIVQSFPSEIQQSGGRPYQIDMVDIDFDPETEVPTDGPTSFWIRTANGETYSLLVSRSSADN